MQNLCFIFFPKLLLGGDEYYNSIQHGPERVKQRLGQKPFTSLYRAAHLVLNMCTGTNSWKECCVIHSSSLNISIYYFIMKTLHIFEDFYCCLMFKKSSKYFKKMFATIFCNFFFFVIAIKGRKNVQEICCYPVCFLWSFFMWTTIKIE